MGEITLMIGTDAAWAAASIRKSPGQAARPARRRGDREQKAVELNSKVPVRMNETKRKKV